MPSPGMTASFNDCVMECDSSCRPGAARRCPAGREPPGERPRSLRCCTRDGQDPTRDTCRTWLELQGSNAPRARDVFGGLLQRIARGARAVICCSMACRTFDGRLRCEPMRLDPRTRVTRLRGDLSRGVQVMRASCRSLRRFFVGPDNAELRGEVALLKRPRHGG